MFIRCGSVDVHRSSVDRLTDTRSFKLRYPHPISQMPSRYAKPTIELDGLCSAPSLHLVGIVQE
jgi:hypothetical protein